MSGSEIRFQVVAIGLCCVNVRKFNVADGEQKGERKFLGEACEQERTLFYK